jgi:hypothetical protein
MIGTAVGLAGGVVGAVGGLFSRGKANNDLRSAMRDMLEYKENPLARQRLGMAQTLLNAKMPGAVAAERGIYQNQSNFNATVGRNATDSSTALALAGAGQAQSNDSFNQLGQMEAQDYQRRYGNLENAQEGVIREQDKVFQNEQQNWNNRVAMQGAINENRQKTWGEIGNLGFGLASFGMSGGFDGLFAGQPKVSGAAHYNSYIAPTNYANPSNLANKNPQTQNRFGG